MGNAERTELLSWIFTDWRSASEGGKKQAWLKIDVFLLSIVANAEMSGIKKNKWLGIITCRERKKKKSIKDVKLFLHNYTEDDLKLLAWKSDF